MLRMISHLGAVLACSSLLFACGSDPDLSGSQCDLIDCGHDIVVCKRVEPLTNQPRALQIHYQRTLEIGVEWAAKITMEFPGDQPISGTRLEGQTFLDQVFLNRPGSVENFPEFTGRYCQIDTGGDENGKKLAGKCAFSFVNGRSMSAKFDCTLEPALVP
jgi:hypothetical protein